MTSPLDRAPDLAAWLDQAGLDELELTGPGGRLLLRRGGDRAVAAAPPDEAPEDAFDVVASPGVGHFLVCHPLREEPLAGPDDAVVAGQTIGLLRVGALLLPVPAPRDGVVARLVAEDRALVSYGDPLVELWPQDEEA